MTIERMIDLYVSGLMVHQVAALAGMSYSTTYRRLKGAGVTRGKKNSIRLSVKQGRFSANRKGVNRPPISEETRARMSEAQKGKGRGWMKKPDGYIYVTTGENAGRGQHVVIMEGIVGRKLKPTECVHHINHDRADNRPENLELMTRSEHARHHATENYTNRKRNNRGQFI